MASDRLTVGVAARLSRYLQVLTQAKKQGRDSISSQEIGEYTNINATQIRRDLSGFGKFGKRGVGYNIDFLIGEIRKILRTSGQHNIVLIGAGSLGQAISKSSIFADHGFNIAGVFDNDPAKVGTDSGDVRIQEMSGAPERDPRPQRDRGRPRRARGGGAGGRRPARARGREDHLQLLRRAHRHARPT